MHSSKPTLSFSILAFRLFCTSRLPSFLAYQIEANIATGETIMFCGQRDSPNGSICCPSGLSGPYQQSVAQRQQRKDEREGGGEGRIMVRERESVCTAKSGPCQP